MFLYIDPLKQGLKLIISALKEMGIRVFIHRSIKTRIETTIVETFSQIPSKFLYIDPLKQGLKPEKYIETALKFDGFYT